MNTSVRIYGKTIQSWKHEDEKGRQITTQREIEYREYSVENGTLVGEGAEDFSTERYQQELVTKLIWVWDGKKRNKGGHRWFECKSSISYARKNAKDIKKYLQHKYKGAKEIQLR